jgi:hypothetical protein
MARTHRRGSLAEERKREPDKVGSIMAGHTFGSRGGSQVAGTSSLIRPSVPIEPPKQTSPFGPSGQSGFTPLTTPSATPAPVDTADAQQAAARQGAARQSVISTPEPTPQVTVTPQVEEAPQAVDAATDVGYQGTGESLQSMTKDYMADVVQGRDPSTMLMVNRFAEESAAREASVKGAAAQRAEMSGLSETGQAVQEQMVARDLESQRQQGLADLAQNAAARQMQAAGTLYGIGQDEIAQGKADLASMREHLDWDNPSEVETYATTYENVHGFKPSLDQMEYDKQMGYKATRQSDLLTDFTNNSSAYFDKNTGSYDPELFVLGNVDTISEEFEAEFGDFSDGLNGKTEFDVNDPEHLAWAERLVKPAMTTVDEQVINDASNTINLWKEQPWYANAGESAQAAMDESFDSWLSIITSGGAVDVAGDSVTITDENGETETITYDKTKSGNTVTYSDADESVSIKTEDGDVYESYTNASGDQVIDVYEDVPQSTANMLGRLEMGEDVKGKYWNATLIDDSNAKVTGKTGRTDYTKVGDQWVTVKEGVPVSKFDSGIDTSKAGSKAADEPADTFRAEGDIWSDDDKYYAKIDDKEVLLNPKNLNIDQAESVVNQMVLGAGEVPSELTDAALKRVSINNPAVNVDESAVRDILDYIKESDTLEIKDLVGYGDTDVNAGDYIISEDYVARVNDDTNFPPDITVLGEDDNYSVTYREPVSSVGGYTVFKDVSITDSNGTEVKNFNLSYTDDRKNLAKYLKTL